jgi:serine O-acetyltransferase
MPSNNSTTPPRKSLVADLWEDMKCFLRRDKRPMDARNALTVALSSDAYALLVMYRTRKWCRERRIPLANRAIRLLETATFGIEIGNDVEIGHGVLFLHTVGVVLGGDAKIGDNCVFLGSNTVGTNGGPGAPRLGSGTIVGAGARILGRIELGEGCMVGANAVVVRDVPSGKVVLGIPAHVVGDVGAMVEERR